MSDGLWNGQGASETLIQPLSRHSFLSVELGNTINDPATNPNRVSSRYASYDPNETRTVPGDALKANSGPHFVMSPETPDNAKTLGLEWCLLPAYLTNVGISQANSARPLTGGFTVTIWCMLANTQTPDGVTGPLWASLLPETGVGFNELYHSFDINVHAIRFQIGNATSTSGGNDTGAILLAMCEL